MKSRKRLHVLVVDDSATVRQGLSIVLGSQPGISVSVAATPSIARRKLTSERPDVMLLDLQLPEMDGVTFLREVMRSQPLPVVVCSAYAGADTRRAMEALQAGAVEVIAKPKLGVREFVEHNVRMLTRSIRAAAKAKIDCVVRPQREPSGVVASPAARPRFGVETACELIAVGASTGGPEALASILADLPEEMPPIVVVQHMPDGFTRAFAERLDQTSALHVREANSGEVLSAGTALVAPGNKHMIVRRRGDRIRVVLLDDGPVGFHKPSVDVLFHSVATSIRDRAVGVLLTGMGADGARGMASMHQAGAHTIAQDEETAVVWGMPREAVAIGAVDRVAALHHIAHHLRRLARDGVPRSSTANGGYSHSGGSVDDSLSSGAS